MKTVFATIILSAVALVQPVQAQEIYAGVSSHATDTPFSLETGEHGVDVQTGIRSAPLTGLAFLGKPSAYVHVQANLNGGTHMAAAGLSWKFGKKIYVRPGIGIAVHNDSIKEFRIDGRRLDLGSRLLFEPEVAVGTKLSNKLAIEASWVHISHAQLLSSQNPGMDFIGARLVFSLQ